MSDAEKIDAATQAFKDISALLTSLAVLDPQDAEEACIHYENTYTAIMQVSHVTLTKLLPGGSVHTQEKSKGVH